MNDMKTICVYCGSSDRMDGVYMEAARRLGRLLAARGSGLVYGGGKTGLMGAVADGVLEGGGSVTGILPRQFYTPELAHPGLTNLEVVADMHARKARMASLADGFIALPGGYGTFEEFFEILTWAQIGLHAKPIGLLDVNGYYQPLLELVRHAGQHGFIYPDHLELFCCAAEGEDLLALMEAYRPPQHLARWVERESYGK